MGYFLFGDENEILSFINSKENKTLIRCNKGIF